MSLIITVFISFLVDIPNNYLFAPEINIDIEIPPETEGGSQVTLKYIHNGLSFIDTKIISLSQGSRISGGLIILTPQENSPASVSLQGRAWNRVQFGFSDYRPGSKVIFHYDGYTDFYYFEKNAQNKEVFTTIEVPRFWFFSLISRVSTLSSIFIILLAFLFSFFCFFGDFFVNLGKKIFLFISNSVILLSAWKGNMLSKWFLWAGLAFFIPWLLNYAWVLLKNPNPAEYREGANLLMTEYFLQGANPFLLENQPLLNTNKGVLYNLVVLSLAAVFGNTLFIHRLVSLIFILLSCLLVILVLRRLSVPLSFALAGGCVLLACLLFYVSPIARVDGLGIFLFLASSLIPWFGNFNKKSLFFGGLIGILGFFTKPYFLLSVIIVTAYLFLFVSKKRGFWYGFLTIMALLTISIVVRKVFECYFLHTIFNSASNASDSDSIKWMFYQILRFTKIFWPIGIMYLILTIYELANERKRIRNNIFNFWRHFDFLHAEKPLINIKTNFFVFFFFVSTITIVLLLGQNRGNDMVYLFQLMAPPLIIFSFQGLYSDFRLGSITVPLVLINLAALCFFVLYPNNPKPYASSWNKLNELVESSQRILNSPLLVSKMIQQNMNPIDSGSSEFYFSTKPYPTNYLAPDYKIVKQQGIDYLKEVERRVINQDFDRIMITKDYSPFCSTEIISLYYELVDNVSLYLPQSDQNWVVQVWVPRS